MISSNIAALRKKHRWTQEALANKVGVSRQTIAKWEAPGGNP
ncbi:helix-turn-helix domain-containing protein, partial [Actinomyces massiliensis]